MIISLSIWIASLLFILAITINKKREVKGKRSFIHIGSEATDIKISTRWANYKNWFRQIDWQYITNHLHRWAERFEKYCLTIAEKIVHKFGNVRDVATGKDLQKNKGHILIRGIFRRLLD